jgi:hypothetical protein
MRVASRRIWIAAGLVLIVLLLLLPFRGASAQEVRTYTKSAAYDDVRFDLTNAIIAAGLTIDYNGHLGKMLDRTGADVGSTKPLYKSAEFFTFCSAKLSRQMMEADLGNIAFCPFVLFIAEGAARPGVVTVGYRRLPTGSDKASQESFAAIEALLDGIAKDAVK